MLTEGHHARGLPLEMISGLLAARPAQRFRFTGKGRLEVGFDADFTLVNLEHTFTLRADDLLYAHRQSPYIGREFRGRVERTLLRGQTVFQNGQVRDVKGRLVTPAAQS
jgi:allantoinase